MGQQELASSEGLQDGPLMNGDVLSDTRSEGNSLESKEGSVVSQAVRFHTRIQSMKDAVADLRVSVKGAIAYREKCSLTLSAAMGATLALEQAAYSGSMSKGREQELARLCSEVVAATDLADARVKVYGGTARWKKLLQMPMRHTTDLKFNEVVATLKELMQRAWTLQGDASSQINISRLGTDELEAERQIEDALQQGQQHTVLARLRLRRGGQSQVVRSLLFIPPHRSTGIHKALGQVWWFSMVLMKGKLCTHDLASGRTDEVAAAAQLPMVLAMHLDGTNCIWTGHKTGLLALWTEGGPTALCSPLRLDSADIIALTSDSQSTIWVGTDSGTLHRVKRHEGGEGTEIVRVPFPATTVAKTKADFESRANSFRAMRKHLDSSSRDVHAGDANIKGIHAHQGQVSVLEGYDGHVWSAGGTSSSNCFKEWSLDGGLTRESDTSEIGMALCIVITPIWGHQEKEALAQRPTDASEVADAWMMLTGHTSGVIQLWGNQACEIVPLARLTSQRTACRGLVVLPALGMWAVAHANGEIHLRQLRAVTASAHKFPQDPAVIPSVDAHHPSAVIETNGGIFRMLGGNLSLVTASVEGVVMLWPEAELRQATEHSRFQLPSGMEAMQELMRLRSRDLSNFHANQEHQDRNVPQVGHDVSRLLERYFTPSSSAQAKAAVQRTLRHTTDHRPSPSSQHSSLTQAAAADLVLSDEQAEQLLAEVVQLLRPQQESERGRLTELMPNSAAPANPGLAAPGSGLIRSSSASTRPSLDDGVGTRSMFPASTGSLAEGTFRAEGCFDWVINRSDLHFIREIGEGSIGRVHLGHWRETSVAIKSLAPVLAKHVPNASQLASILSSRSKGESLASSGEGRGSPGTPGGNRTDLRLADSLLSSQASMLESLEREALIMASLRHPNVVLFMGICLDPPCLVTEWCSRGSLYDVIGRAASKDPKHPPLDWMRSLSMALDAAKGMLQLHTHRPQILHRDLKSPNLVVDKHWRVKVTDFNLSLIDGTDQDTGPVSANNPRWLAPESIRAREFSTQSDVFSFGVILWELLTWERPWDDLGTFQIMTAVLEKSQRPDIPQDLGQAPMGNSMVAAPFVALLKSCWAQVPAERPDFAVIIAALRGMLERLERARMQSGPRRRRSSAVVASDEGSVDSGGPAGQGPHSQSSPREANQAGSGGSLKSIPEGVPTRQPSSPTGQASMPALPTHQEALGSPVHSPATPAGAPTSSLRRTAAAAAREASAKLIDPTTDSGLSELRLQSGPGPLGSPSALTSAPSEGFESARSSSQGSLGTDRSSTELSASQRTSIDQQSRRSSEHRLSGESVSTAAHRLGCRSGEGAASEGQPSAERRSFDRGSRGSFEGRPPLSPQVPPQTLQGFSPFANAPAFGPTSQTPIGSLLTVQESQSAASIPRLDSEK